MTRWPILQGDWNVTYIKYYNHGCKIIPLEQNNLKQPITNNEYQCIATSISPSQLLQAKSLNKISLQNIYCIYIIRATLPTFSGRWPRDKQPIKALQVRSMLNNAHCLDLAAFIYSNSKKHSTKSQLLFQKEMDIYPISQLLVLRFPSLSSS